MILEDLIGDRDPSRIALRAPDHQSMTYGALAARMRLTRAGLRAAGIGPQDKVAMVLPNGPEMAVAFLSLGSGAVAAPLNPAYREDEFHFYMEDLKVTALVSIDGPAVAAAKRLGVPVLSLADLVAPGDAPPPQPDDVALVLHTSGTTSRPKIVPLTHANLIASANNIVRTLSLTAQDRCLNIMPLFHIHGLVAAILATLASGGSITCTPGFNALKFFGWLEEAKPTWYTAVPTMHQAILSRAGRNAAIIESHPLRFIRSSSASLPAPVFHELERVFGCPVVEAYAMTENAHQMTSNRLPPGLRKAGTVGAAAGPEVAVMSADGQLLGTGEEGEVVTRGPNITAGYENNPQANADAFAHGWFHTGDQGVMDADGYLKITGRLKEIINRGGEKVSPVEVDEVLLDHPAVHQAVTFAMPHDKLGEDVAAAVVLREGASATERELRDFATKKLAGYKVPHKIVFVAEIPKGATGKLQRIGLAAKLGLA